MRASPCLDLQLSDDERVALLLEDYAFFVEQPALFCERLQALVSLRGHEVVQRWQRQVHAGQFEQVVRELLLFHYDPGYLQSMRRNFSGYGQAKKIAPADRSAGAMAALAAELVVCAPTRRGDRSRCRSDQVEAGPVPGAAAFARVRLRRRRPDRRAARCRRPGPACAPPCSSAFLLSCASWQALSGASRIRSWV